MEKICSICEQKKQISEFERYSRKCKECINLTRCFKCSLVKENTEFRKGNPGICKKCLNKVKYDRKKKNPTEVFKEKLKRNNKNKYQRSRPNPSPKRIKLDINQAKAIKRMRQSVHRIFRNWMLNKRKSSFDYLNFTREQFLEKFPMIPDNQEIDHLIPITWFKEETPISIIFDINNLQLLSPEENRKKGNLYCHKPTSEEYLQKALPWIKSEYLKHLTIP